MAGIVHVAVKSSGDKGLASEWNADHEITGDIDQDQNSFLNAVIENGVAFPAGPIAGQIIYRSDLFSLYQWNGTAWMKILTTGGTSYWTVPGLAFVTFEPLVDDIINDADNGVFMVDSGSNIGAGCPVQLPNGATITAVAVYGNGPYNWGMYRDALPSSGFPLAMASGTVAAPATDAHGFLLNNTDSSTVKAGFKFTPIINIVAQYVVKSAACTATKGYILDSSKVVLYTGTFSGNIATFPTNKLTAGTTYYMVVDNAGASYTRTLNYLDQAYPVNKTNITYVKALDDTSESLKAFNIVSMNSLGLSEDTTITGPVVDNNNYRYWIECFPLDAGEEIDSVRITYTI